MVNNKKCIVCGSEYSYCPSCLQDRKKPKWMSRFDKEDCKEIFEIGCAFEQGSLSADKAVAKLEGKNLNNIISPSLKASIAKIKGSKVLNGKKEDAKKSEPKTSLTDKADKSESSLIDDKISVKKDEKKKKFFE